jgi:hypothetical protein
MIAKRRKIEYTINAIILNIFKITSMIYGIKAIKNMN